MVGRLLLAFLCMTLMACKQEEVKGGPYRELSVIKTSRDFLIPLELKKKIEANYIKWFRSEDPTNIDTDEKLMDKLPRDFLEVDVFFSQKNPGAFERDFVFRSPRGGGLIDLKNLVTGTKGSFFVRFDVTLSGGENIDIPPGFQAYFISNTPPRKIGDEKFGSDCRILIDITNDITGSMAGLGLRVNATEARYFNSLVGDYFFVGYAKEKILLASVSIDDSSRNFTRCRK